MKIVFFILIAIVSVVGYLIKTTPEKPRNSGHCEDDGDITTPNDINSLGHNIF